MKPHLLGSISASASSAPPGSPTTLLLELSQRDSTYDDVVLTDSPVLYLPLDDGETPFKDLSGSNNEATLFGTGTLPTLGAYLTPDNASTAPYFGANRRQARVGTPLHLTGDISVEAWVYYDSPNSDAYPQVVSESTGVDGWNLFVTGAGNWGWIVKVSGQSWGNNYIDSGVPASASWKHLVATRNATTGAMDLYVNKISHATSAPAGAIDYAGGSVGLIVGGKGDPVGSRIGAYLARIAVYDHVLTPTQVNNHYDVGVQYNYVPFVPEFYVNGNMSDGTAYRIRTLKFAPTDRSSLDNFGTVSL